MRLEPRLPSFAMELFKISSAALEKAQQKADAHFDAPQKDWRSFEKNLRSKAFQQVVSKHGLADSKLKKYVKNFGGYVTGKDAVAELKSKDSGRTYTIKDLHNGRYACGCKDWQYKKSVGGGDCKHIKSLKQSGMLKKVGSLHEMVKTSFMKDLAHVATTTALARRRGLKNEIRGAVAKNNVKAIEEATSNPLPIAHGGF